MPADLTPGGALQVQLLDSASLCYLSTTDGSNPHLSLMNFTFIRSDDLLVFSTRRETLKAKFLAANPQVAILVHDFPTLARQRSSEASDGFGSTFSITLYGRAEVLDDDTALSKRLRQAHLQHNPTQSVFIEGPGIAVVKIEIEHARVCDAADSVTSWSVIDGWGDSPPPKPSVAGPERTQAT